MEMLDGMGDMNKWFMTCNYLPHKLGLTAPQSLHQNSQQTHPHYQKCPQHLLRLESVLINSYSNYNDNGGVE